MGGITRRNMRGKEVEEVQEGKGRYRNYSWVGKAHITLTIVDKALFYPDIVLVW